MIKEIKGQLTAGKGKYAIVVSRFNEFITGKLLGGAVDCLQRHGVDDAFGLRREAEGRGVNEAGGGRGALGRQQSGASQQTRGHGKGERAGFHGSKNGQRLW